MRGVRAGGGRIAPLHAPFVPAPLLKERLVAIFAAMSRSPIFILLALSTVAVGCSSDSPAEHYGFVTLLGRDTVAVERVARSSRRLVADGVDQWPLVRRRHTEFELGGDGKIKHMVMDVSTPSGSTPAERSRRITADYSNDRVKISIRDSSGVRDTSFVIGDALAVPHVSMMYSVIELEIAYALAHAAVGADGKGADGTFRQYYPDRDIGRSFALHRGVVHPAGNGRVELRHDWLSGTGDVTVDSAGRMLTYSGKRSTYQVQVTRTDSSLDVEGIGNRLAEREAQRGAAQLSVRDTTRATIGAASVTVDYGRPLARGRQLLGNVISLDRVWRTGANAATQLSTTAPLSIGGLDVPAGTYTLWTVLHQNGAELIVNKQHGQWGTQYSRGEDLGTVPLKTETVADTVEKFTIALDQVTPRNGTLALSWGTFRWTAPIAVR